MVIIAEKFFAAIKNEKKMINFNDIVFVEKFVTIFVNQVENLISATV